MLCPHCQTELRTVKEATPVCTLLLDYCPNCRGIWFDAGELELLLAESHFDKPLFQLVDSPQAEALKRCPRHGLLMQKCGVSTGRLRQRMYGQTGNLSESLVLDQCAQCLGIWFDGGELAQVSSVLSSTSTSSHPLLAASFPPPLAPAAGSESPTSALLWAFMFLTGLPVEHDHPRKRFPMAVVVLIFINAMAFLATMGSDNPEVFTRTFGLIPNRSFHGSLFPWLSYMFLHANLFHILANMYFLWVFGDNVEDRLGWPHFVGVYFASGVAAALLQVLLQNERDMPLVGASGAVSGVMAAYAVLFLHARLSSLIFVLRVQWKSSTYVLFWLGLQFLGALTGVSQIAWWAHIGGFLIGGLIAWRWRAVHLKEAEQKLHITETTKNPLAWY
jgi:membrane associated rhomboid family serine protease/Zn-finger nucleic acid-binding protein